MSQTHKYPINYQFKISKNDKIYYGTIIKYASIDEFGGDFYFTENNYVVEFDVNNIALATYNFINTVDTTNKSITYNYVMNEADIK